MDMKFSEREIELSEALREQSAISEWAITILFGVPGAYAKINKCVKEQLGREVALYASYAKARALLAGNDARND